MEEYRELFGLPGIQNVVGFIMFIWEITDEIGNVEYDSAVATIWKHMFENFPRQCGKFIIAAYERRKNFFPYITFHLPIHFLNI